MQSGSVTTPFGRRPMTLALVRRQVATSEASKDRPVDKWQVFRDVCESRALLGVQDRALAVLDALLTFHPVSELSSERAMVVFPSNAQLSVRAHGIAGTTLRRQLAALVEAGLVIRRDSPNGKRYARKDRDGEIETAYGFDLSPLHARAEELALMAQQVVAERMRFRRVKEELTIVRRDVRKLISAAMEEGADGDWSGIEDIYIALCARIPRRPDINQLVDLVEEMEMLRTEIINLLDAQENSQKTDTNDDRSGRHIQNSKSDSIHELEPRSEEEQGAKPADDEQPKREPVPIKNFPVGMVLRACPDIAMYGPGGTV
ncbi:replication initiation protein RepC, partial [bacterium]